MPRSTLEETSRLVSAEGYVQPVVTLFAACGRRSLCPSSHHLDMLMI